MPKRTLDTAAAAGTAGNSQEPGSPLKIQKTERSHEENQERAYIAASRRADRSLEARVQSAKMASEIHRRRTGRALKVSEDIVVKEEMYEEEEDDMPRPFRYLNSHLQTNSPDMNNRVNAYLSTQAMMATMARYNEVNRLFSESFPSAGMMQQQLNNSIYSCVSGQAGSSASNNNNNPLSPTCVSQDSPITERNSSIGDSSAFDARHTRRASNVTAMSSPPVLSPVSDTTSIPPYSSKLSMDPPAPRQPSQQQAQEQEQPPAFESKSAFTSELPNEAKMMANIVPGDPMAPFFFGGPDASSCDWPSYNPAQFSKQVEAPAYDDLLSPDASTPVSDAAKQKELQKSPYELQDSVGSLGSDYVDFDFGSDPTGLGASDGWENFVDFGSEQ